MEANSVQGGRGIPATGATSGSTSRLAPGDLPVGSPSPWLSLSCRLSESLWSPAERRPLLYEESRKPPRTRGPRSRSPNFFQDLGDPDGDGAYSSGRPGTDESGCPD
eukprot:3348528-Pyramimonas_sp.AAC.1